MSAASDLDVERLTAWLGANVAGFSGPTMLTKFAGGQSNPTYRIDSPSGTYVLRRKPFGTLLPSAHAVDREYRLIAALHPTGFPVPRPYALCTDDDVIGAMFYVMELVEGRTFWDGSLPDMPGTERQAVYESMIDTLAGLHDVDVAAAGLESYGRPGNYFARQVERWSKQYRASQTDDLPEMDALIAWLPRTLPEQTRTSIIHGDYRIDNLIYAPAAPRVAAVLDWELSTLGDPLADFAYLLMNWALPHQPGKATLAGLDLTALGIPSVEAASARYCAATGRDDVPRLDWYFAYSLFRMAGIVQGIKQRMRDGNASSTEAESMVARMPGLVATGWDYARRAGAPAL